MRGDCRAAWFEQLIASMLRSNGPAAEVFREAGLAACTDVTGFGLAGHLLEVLDASGVSARLNVKEIRLYTGFEEVVSRDVVSTLQGDNARAACRVMGKASAWLFDPQTTGGLLGAVAEEVVTRTLERLHEAGCPDAAMIGEVVPTGAGDAPAILLG